MKSYNLKSNGYFSIIKDPYSRKQHPNQQGGLDLYVEVLNEDSGELCCKKLYENKKGVYFKHSGYSPNYLTDFNTNVKYIPFQIIKE